MCVCVCVFCHKITHIYFYAPKHNPPLNQPINKTYKYYAVKTYAISWTILHSVYQLFQYLFARPSSWNC